MSVFSNITTTLLKRKRTNPENGNKKLYIIALSMISVTIGLIGYTLYKVNQLDFSNLRFPIF